MPDGELMVELKPKFEVEFIEKNRRHFYKIKGQDKLYPSVTWYLNMIGGSKTTALQTWAKNLAVEYIANSLRDKIGNDIKITENFINEMVLIGKQQPKWNLEKAADVGTKAHNAFDYYIHNGKAPEMDEQTTHLFNNFLDWVNEHKIKFIMPDTAVVCNEEGMMVGGKFDAVAQDEDGKLILIDFKSSNHISEDYAMQLSFYFHAFKCTYGVELDKGMIVRFDKKEPKFQIQEISKDKMIKNYEACKGLIALKNTFEEGVWE